MKEEKILIEKFGKVNHFTVPEGYFDSFADQLMEQLPESAHRVIDIRAQKWWSRIPLRKMAAVIGIGIVLAGGAVMVDHKMASRQQIAVGSQVEIPHEGNTEYGTFEQMADYTMMDNQDIYATLVAEN